MKVRWAHVLLAVVLLAPLGLCVGCECKNDSDCGTQVVAQFVGTNLVNAPVPLHCRDKECNP